MIAFTARKFALVAAVAVLAGGCNEVRGRRKVQEANRLYRDAAYKEAVAVFEEAEKYVPELPELWLNKGYTCKQMVVPGAKTPESMAAAKCALASFKRYQEIKPEDMRGEMLYIQTLFDSDEFETLSNMYLERFKKDPKNIEAVNGLIQVYSKWKKLDETLEWYTRKAEVLANDAEAQYGAGVYIWSQLFQKGGGGEFSSYDPRVVPKLPPPANAYGDIISQQRVDLSDSGLKFLEKALALRPTYHDAMTYINLMYRQKSFAYFDDIPEWQKNVDLAMSWFRKSMEAQGKKIAAPTPAPVAEGEEAPDPATVAPDKKKKGPDKKKKPPRKGKRSRKR